MNNIKRLQNISTYIGVFIGTVFITIFYDYLKTYNLSTHILILFLFLFFIFIVEIMRSLSQIIVNNSSIVRRIILQGDYIEGLWRDVTTWDSGEKSYGFYIIRYCNDSYKIIGREFDSKGDMICDWNSIISDYDGNCLLYLYSSRWTKGKTIQEKYGIVSLSFMRSSPTGIPKTSSGYFIDIATDFRKVATNSEKISDHGFKEISDIKGTKKMIIDWINQHNEVS